MLGLIHFPFCLKFLFVVLIITFLMSSLSYMMFYQNCTVTSYYFVVLLKQTTQVKTLSIAHVTISQQSPFNVSGGQSQQRLMFQHGSFLLAFMKLQTWHFALFSLGTFHSPVSILTLNATYSHSDHRPHHIISQFCTVFNQNICLCLP